MTCLFVIDVYNFFLKKTYEIAFEKKIDGNERGVKPDIARKRSPNRTNLKEAMNIFEGT